MTVELNKHSEKILKLAVLSVFMTWLMVMIWGIKSGSAELATERYWYVPIYLLYIMCFVGLIFQTKRYQISSAVKVALAFLMICFAYSLEVSLIYGNSEILAILWVVTIGMIFPLRNALLGTFLMLAIWHTSNYYLLDKAQWKAVSIFGSLHVFALLLAAVIKALIATKRENEANNRQLKATQHLLKEASRQAERTRIARDLHDLLGHHLTALTIKLQVASRLANGDSKEQIDNCHQISKLLLNDVRDAVDTLRNNEEIDFRQSLSILLHQVPELDIQLNIERWVTIDSFPVAQGLLRCIQESVTNTLKHSKATRMSIIIECDKDNVITTITDNGTVTKTLALGNGLRGMRERVTQLRGTVQFETASGAMEYIITLPRNE